jgi:predicted nucleic acid-binding protein
VNSNKIVVDTDIIFDYLSHVGRGVSLLRIAMKNYLCYTTVFNAIELFSSATSARHVRTMEQALGAMKILGLNARSAKNFGLMMRKYPHCSDFDLLKAGICLEGKLSLLTCRPDKYRGIKNLRCVSPSLIK